MSIRNTIAPPETAPAPARRLSPVGPGSPARMPAGRRVVPARTSPERPRRPGSLAGFVHLALDGLWFRVALGAILALGAMSVNWALQILPVEPAGAPTATIVPLASADAPVAAPSSVPASAASPRSHVVASGDTLIGLAGRYYGDESRWPEILDANLGRIGDPDNLRIGTELLIPDP